MGSETPAATVTKYFHKGTEKYIQWVQEGGSTSLLLKLSVSSMTVPFHVSVRQENSCSLLIIRQVISPFTLHYMHFILLHNLKLKNHNYSELGPYNSLGVARRGKEPQTFPGLTILLVTTCCVLIPPPTFSILTSATFACFRASSHFLVFFSSPRCLRVLTSILFLLTPTLFVLNL